MEQNSEQEPDDSLASFQSNSPGLPQRRKLAAQTRSEHLEPPDQPAASGGSEQTAGSQVSHRNIVADFCTAEGSSSTERQGGKVKPDSVNPFHVTAVMDREKDIALLLKELDSLRSHNQKLQDNLSKKDKELKAVKLDLELHERAAEAKIAEQAAALVEEIRSAQREREEAILARVKVANDERDNAWKRVKQLEQFLETLENINPEENDMTLQELLNRINNAGTGTAIRKNGARIVDRISRIRERKKKIVAEEMNAVIEEREAALAQCKRLEQELHHMKEQNQTSANNPRHLTAENNQERALKGKFLAMQQEREAAVQQYKTLEEEIQTLRVYYSLHQSLSQEVDLKDQFNATLTTYEKALKNREEIVSLLLLQNEELAAQLQQAGEERASMELKFQQTLETSQQASQQLQKLQRLVDVLRKKVGAGAVRTVI